ncbi:unnamed protein product [Coregonus sp. 'balchen']|nr:unnamed protein product [Coregonus sp. 'balchen']
MRRVNRVSHRDSPSHSPVEHPVSTVEEVDQEGQGKPPQNHLQARDFHRHFLSSAKVKQDGHPSMVDRLLENHGACIPQHDPHMYTEAAALTKSIPGKKVFEDIQCLPYTEDIINEVVFDLEDPSSPCSLDHSKSLSFFSKFECGNLRKAVHVRSGMAANVPYRFNIINCEKANSQFNDGLSFIQNLSFPSSKAQR